MIKKKKKPKPALEECPPGEARGEGRGRGRDRGSVDGRPRGEYLCEGRGEARGVSFFFSSRRRHTRCYRDWSSDVCSSDLAPSQRRTRGEPDRAPSGRE